jgi:hypothetical protein
MLVYIHHNSNIHFISIQDRLLIHWISYHYKSKKDTRICDKTNSNIHFISIQDRLLIHWISYHYKSKKDTRICDKTCIFLLKYKLCYNQTEHKSLIGRHQRQKRTNDILYSDKEPGIITNIKLIHLNSPCCSCILQQLYCFTCSF